MIEHTLIVTDMVASKYFPASGVLHISGVDITCQDAEKNVLKFSRTIDEAKSIHIGDKIIIEQSQ